MEHPFENLPLLLATGQGRSGTTVLTKAIAAHPDVYSNGVESNVMHDILIAGANSTNMESRVRQMVVSREQHDRIFHNMLLRLLFPEPESGSMQPKQLSTFSAMNSEIAPFLTEIFPSVHFANIVRNGIEVVASRMVHRTMKVHSFEDQCIAWADAVDMAKWGNGRQDFTLIRHESLLNESSCSEVFENLFERAGLSPHNACQRYVSNNTRHQTTYEQEDSNDARGLGARKDRWQFWDDSQKTSFKSICGDAMDYFGYEVPW